MSHVPHHVPGVQWILMRVCVCVCVFFPRGVSGNGEARRGGAGGPDSDAGPGPRPAHLSKQRGPHHPGRHGGQLAPRPAPLPASQRPPAQLPAQRQHARLRERWVHEFAESDLPDSSELGKPGPRLEGSLITMRCVVQEADCSRKLNLTNNHKPKGVLFSSLNTFSLL